MCIKERLCMTDETLAKWFEAHYTEWTEKSRSSDMVIQEALQHSRQDHSLIWEQFHLKTQIFSVLWKSVHLECEKVSGQSKKGPQNTVYMMIKEWWKEQEVAHSTAWRMTVLAESLVSKNNNQWKQLNSDITKSFSISEVYIFTEYVSGSSHHAMRSIFGFIVLLHFHYSFIYKKALFSH